MTHPAGDSDRASVTSSGEPLAFRVDGRDISIPGAWRFPEGIYVPTESVFYLQEFLADRPRLLAQMRRLERKLEESDPARNHEVLKARAFIWRISRLMDAGPEAMAEWLDNLLYNRPLLEAKAEVDALATELQDCRARLTARAMEEEASAVAEEMDRALLPLLDAMLEDPAIASLRIDRNRLLMRLYRRADDLFTDASEEIPLLGIRRGELLVNESVLRAEVQAAVDLARTVVDTPPRPESAPTLEP